MVDREGRDVVSRMQQIFRNQTLRSHLFSSREELHRVDSMSVDWMYVFNGKLHWYYEGYNPYIYSFDGKEITKEYQLRSPDMGKHGSAEGEAELFKGYFWKGYQHYAKVVRIDSDGTLQKFDTPFDPGAGLYALNKSSYKVGGEDLYLGGANWSLDEHPGRIYASEDNGETWTKVFETTNNNRAITRIFELTDQDIMIALAGQVTGKIEQNTADAWTSDNGTNWTNISIPADIGAVYTGEKVYLPSSWATENQVIVAGDGGTARRAPVYMWDGSSFTRLAQFPNTVVWDSKSSSTEVLLTLGAKYGEVDPGRSHPGEVWEIDLRNLSMHRLTSFRNAVPTAIENFLGNTYVGLSYLPYRRRWEIVQHTKTIIKRIKDHHENPPLQVTLWDGEAISAGDTSPSQIVGGWDKVTVFLETDTGGTFTIQVNPDGSGWRTYDTRDLTAGDFDFYTITSPVGLIRLKFDAGATVSAWLQMR